MAWHLRRATDADAERIAEITVAGWRWAYRGIVPDERLAELDVAVVAQRRRAAIAAAEPAAVLVAENGAGVAGYVIVGPVQLPDDAAGPARPTGELQALYLDPVVIGTGAGSALHDAGLAHLAAAGFERAVLWAFVGNETGLAFYARHGWEPHGEPVQREGWSAPAVRRQRVLSR